MQVNAVRSGVWMKDGMKDRIRKASKRLMGKSETSTTVASET